MPTDIIDAVIQVIGISALKPFNVPSVFQDSLSTQLAFVSVLAPLCPTANFVIQLARSVLNVVQDSFLTPLAFASVIVPL